MRAEEAPKPCPTNRALAVSASVVPGAVVHGLGHFLTCEPKTGRKLLFLQGVGVTTTAISGAGLALSGASRYLVAPLALGAVGGLGLFAISYLADVYGVLTPVTGAGRPARTNPALVLQYGVRFVYDPLFESSFLLSQGLFLDSAGFWLGWSTPTLRARGGLAALRGPSRSASASPLVDRRARGGA